MHVERTFTVNRPVDEVFDYLSDFENTNEWDPGTVETVRTTGDGGLGSTYANRSTFMGREVELRYETISYQRPHLFQCRGRNAGSTSTDSMTFTPVLDGAGDRTRIHYRADFTFHGVTRVLAPLVVPFKLDALADETVEQIRRVLG